MTCVIAVRTKNEALMAYDSLVTYDDVMHVSSTPKALIHAGNGIMGGAGSWTVLNAMQELKGVECAPEEILQMFEKMKEGISAKSSKDSSVLMAWPGRPLVEIQADGSVIQLTASFHAIGLGAPFALGYLESCRSGINADDLKEALAVAAKYSPSVGKPFHVLSVKARVKEKSE